MEQLPKIVAQRLQAVSRPETHPDANLLAAFAEKSLLPREQAQILEHLAGCPDCREVVAHAQPEEMLQHVAVAAAAPTAARWSWFSGTAVKWGMLAACVVAVGAVVISTQLTKPIGRPIAANNEPAIVAKNESQTQLAPPSSRAEEKPNTSTALKKFKSEPTVATRRDTDQLAELDKQRAGDTITSDSARERRKDETSLNGLAANSNSPVASAPVATAAPQQDDAKSTKKEFSADKAMRAATSRNEVAQAQPAPTPPPPQSAAAKAAPALADSPTVTVEAAPVVSTYNQKDGYVSGAAIGGLARMRIVIPMWQLSEDGKLIKSLDHGQNWQPVPVGDAAILRALCVTGNEIWVGGAQGKLFYSSDAGQQWEQVKPMSKGQTLTADITGIEFKDSNHGKVTTADHQTWTTNDDGHSWKVETR